MTEALVALVVFLLFFLAMSLSYLVRGKPIKGSCGNVSALMGQESCEICGGDPARCEEARQPGASQGPELFHDASRKE